MISLRQRGALTLTQSAEKQDLQEKHCFRKLTASQNKAQKASTPNTISFAITTANQKL